MDAEREFADFIRQAGLQADRICMDGKWRNVPLAGQKNGKSGGYMGFMDSSPHGYTHNHRTGERLHWTPQTELAPLTPEQADRRAAERHLRAAERERERRAEQAGKAALAKYLWNKAVSADPNHPYLVRKKIGPHDLRQLQDTLIVALTDPRTDEIWNLQFISPEGEKRPLSGARKQGLVHVFGTIVNRFTISEGASTAISIHESLQAPAVMAIDAGNMASAARALRERYPDAAILVCGDQDAGLPFADPPCRNVGKEKAEEVARQILAQYSLPDSNRISRDWNDVFCDFGREETARQIKANRLDYV